MESVSADVHGAAVAKDQGDVFAQYERMVALDWEESGADNLTGGIDARGLGGILSFAKSRLTRVNRKSTVAARRVTLLTDQSGFSPLRGKRVWGKGGS